mgnify:CR=1 FL=1
MSEQFHLLESVRKINDTVELATKQFLESMGWKYTCDTCSLWLWGKEIDGKQVRVGESTAMWIAESEVKLPYEGNSEHPKDYDGPCGCDECLAYAC